MWGISYCVPLSFPKAGSSLLKGPGGRVGQRAGPHQEGRLGGAPANAEAAILGPNVDGRDLGPVRLEATPLPGRFY